MKSSWFAEGLSLGSVVSWNASLSIKVGQFAACSINALNGHPVPLASMVPSSPPVHLCVSVLPANNRYFALHQLWSCNFSLSHHCLLINPKLYVCLFVYFNSLSSPMLLRTGGRQCTVKNMCKNSCVIVLKFLARCILYQGHTHPDKFLVFNILGQ